MAKQGAQMGRTSALGLTVLLVAPDSGLPKAADEVQRVINLLHPTVLLGDVTVGDVLEAVAGGTFGIVWFLGHSGADGLQLSDGVLSAAHFTQILRQSPPSLVVLNSCSSLHIALQVHDDLQAAVIATVLDVPDLDAYITGAALAGALSQGKNVQDAYHDSRPSYNRQYVLLNGSIRMNGENETDDLKRLVASTQQEMHREIAGMVREQAAMRREVVALRREFADMGQRYAPILTRTRAAGVVAGFMLCGVAYSVVELRDLFHTHPVVTAGFAGLAIVVAAWLLLWGGGYRLDK